jgi:RHS repeat-associated protein
MAMSVVYTTVNGQILRENRGGVVSDFVPDPLGSVVMVQDASGAAVYKAEYDPYGNVQSETGTNPSSLGYVGTLGYIKNSATSLYVRARYLLNNLGRWLTKDPLWPSEPGYVYAGATPNMNTDPSGLVATGTVGTGIVGLIVIGLVIYIAGVFIVVTLANLFQLISYCLNNPGACTIFPGGGGSGGTGGGSGTGGGGGGNRVDARKAKPRLEPDVATGEKCRPLGPFQQCPPKPPDFDIWDMDQKSGHYFKHLGCCCRGPHAHRWTYNQGPPPVCYLQAVPNKNAGTCLGPCTPGPC